MPENCQLSSSDKTIWDMTQHRNWGNMIDWADYRQQTLTGHISRSHKGGLKVGDHIRCPLQSGVIGVFELIEVDYMSEPEDLFFAKSKPLRTETVDGNVVHSGV